MDTLRKNYSKFDFQICSKRSPLVKISTENDTMECLLLTFEVKFNNWK